MAYRIQNVSGTTVAIDGDSLIAGEYKTVSDKTLGLDALAAQGLITITAVASSSETALAGAMNVGGDALAVEATDLTALAGALNGDGDALQVDVVAPLSTVTAVSTGLTTEGADDPVQLAVGTKTFVASLTGTGAVDAAVNIEGSLDDSLYVILTTLTLDGTDSDFDAYTSTDAYAYHRINITDINGTDASVSVSVGQ